MAPILWLLTSLAISPEPTTTDLAAELKVEVAEAAILGVSPGHGPADHAGPTQTDGCASWRFTGPEHCRWMHRSRIDAYMACIRAIQRACEGRAQPSP